MLVPESGLVVIDTNIALDLLVFEDPAWVPLIAMLAAGELRWLATAAMRVELERVLGYPLIARRMAQRGLQVPAVLADFDARVRMVEGVPSRAPCVCSRPRRPGLHRPCGGAPRAAAQQGPRGAVDEEAAGPARRGGAGGARDFVAGAVMARRLMPRQLHPWDRSIAAARRNARKPAD